MDARGTRSHRPDIRRRSADGLRPGLTLGGSWYLTERLHQGAYFDLFRAAAVGSRPDRGFAAEVRGEGGHSVDGQPNVESPHRRGDYVIKLLRPQWHQSESLWASWYTEATLGREVAHPNLISVLAAGEIALEATRIPYLVFPFLKGQTLRDHVQARLDGSEQSAFQTVGSSCHDPDSETQNPCLPRANLGALGMRTPGDITPGDILTQGWSICEALGTLHDAGWRHGDVRPENVFVAADGHVTVLDLGSAARVGATQDVFFGDVRYAAPETLHGRRPIGAEADIYSLGLVLYEGLAGQSPFHATTAAEWKLAHRRKMPTRLSWICPQIDAGLDVLIMMMLAKDPLRRPSLSRVQAQLNQGLTTRGRPTIRRRTLFGARTDTAHRPEAPSARVLTLAREDWDVPPSPMKHTSRPYMT